MMNRTFGLGDAQKARGGLVRDTYEGNTAMPAQRNLTTAEGLVLEVLIAHQLLGATSSTFPHGFWVRPQLDSLKELGVITWGFNDDGDFEAWPTPTMATLPEAQATARRFGRASVVRIQSVNGASA